MAEDTGRKRDGAPELTAAVLIDNMTRGPLCSEWGLSFYIEYRGHRILLDAGASYRFADNAQAMGIPLGEVEYGILSHAHYDHADGIDTFFRKNSRAKFYFRDAVKEDCYGGLNEPRHYIGIRRGMLKDHADRIRFVSGDYELLPGVTLLPHKTGGLDAVGIRSGMYRYVGWQWIPDDYSHEQSVVFETEQGLVIFNSCSHGGADIIIREAAETFPDKPVYAMIGGFHLYETEPDEVRRFARRVKETGIRRIVTGHCTGEDAFAILKDELGDVADQMYSGYCLAI